MGRLTAAGLLAACGLAVAAPGLKDPPMAAPPVVGTWRLVSVDGKDPGGYSVTETFQADGTLVSRSRLGQEAPTESRSRYAADTTANPPGLDFALGDGATIQAIFEVDGDTLTYSYRPGRGDRPTAFGQDSSVTAVFKRVTPKD